MDSFNISYSMGIDGFSIWFILLSTFLIPLCILVSWENIKFRIKEFLILLLFLEFLLIQIFCITDLIFFYILFEAVLIPMFIMIGVWGSRERKIFAAYQFFIYTFVGSVLMLIAIIYLYVEFGTSSYFELLFWTVLLPAPVQLFLWLGFFISFAVKVPMIPVHVWLPEAHVEAPTAGSVLLAGILLKLGGYGMLRFLIPLFPLATVYFIPFVYCISIVGIIYTSAVTIRQVDLKKIIAYSSVAHMNFVTIGLFSLTANGIEGSIFLMLSHGIVSSALFICIGILYDRYHSRLLFYYGGLNMVMPIYSTFFLIFTLANMGLPGLSNFVGELLVLLGVYTNSTSTAFLAAIGTVLGAVYSIWIYNRIMFGVIQTEFITEYCDVNKREFFILFLLSSISFFFGIYPNCIFSVLHYTFLYSFDFWFDGLV
jgi:NADH-quinone oxidoreductase subunit M